MRLLHIAGGVHAEIRSLCIAGGPRAEIQWLHIAGGRRGSMAAGQGYHTEPFARPSSSTYDGPRSREVRAQRVSPPRFDRARKMSPPHFDRDDGPPPMKRGRGGGRPPMSRGPQRGGSFAPRRFQSRR